MALGALGEGMLGRRSARHHGPQARLDLLASGSRRSYSFLSLRKLLAACSDRLASKLIAGLQHLVLQALVQLGRLGLALERAQASTRLALHILAPYRGSLGCAQA